MLTTKSTLLARIVCDLKNVYTHTHSVNQRFQNYQGKNSKITNYKGHRLLGSQIIRHVRHDIYFPRIVTTPAHTLREIVAALGLQQ